MIVVSDTSPVTYLHQIGRLEWLRSLYGQVLVPPAVERELRVAAVTHADLDWSILKVVPPRNVEQLAALEIELDPGESEAIVLALELKADLLLIDEATGRDVALRLGLRRIGLLGVLMEAKRQRLAPLVGPELARLLAKTTFRIQEEVRREFLSLVGEPL